MTQFPSPDNTKLTQKVPTGLRIFMFLFGLPFLAGGLGTGYLFFSKLSAEGVSSETLPLGVFATVFTCAGIFITFIVPRLMKSATQEFAAKKFGESDDDEAEQVSLKPWLDNPVWAKGKVECANQGAMYGLWIFAIIWSAISFPASYAAIYEALEKESYGGLFVVIFPLIGLLLIYAAIWTTIRWRKFGASVFEIANQTGYVGGDLRGIIKASVEIATTGGYTLKLKCLEHITTGSGKNRRTTTHVRWEQEKKLSLGGVSSRLGIPVSFQIPSSCMEVDDNVSVGRVAWVLEVHAPVKGVDYSAEFPVPVFKRPEERGASFNKSP